MEVAPYNITVNAYAPGIIGTAMWEEIDEGLARVQQERTGKVAQKGDMMKRQVEQLTAMGRVGTAEDVSKVVSFLAGPDSEFVTGQTSIVDGGIVMN
jgi:NAD(P)-dependent dehydrogenase (short-subunit alcohol dehydrogenase family)